MSDVDALLAELDSAPLTTLLQRSLRLARKQLDSPFERWIQLELHGYVNSNAALREMDVVPEYRTVVGQHSDDYGRALRLTDAKLGFVNETRLRFSVSELEELHRRGGIVSTYDPTLTSLIRQHLNVEVSRFSFDAFQIATITGSIRAKLGEYLHGYQRSPRGPDALSVPTSNEEIIELKPNIAGLGINLRALWRRVRRWWVARRW